MNEYRKNDNKTLTSKLEWNRKYDAEKWIQLELNAVKKRRNVTRQ